METKNNSEFYGGLVLLILGMLFLLDNLAVLDFGDFISTFWPLALILIGIHLIMKVRKNKSSDPELDNRHENHNAVASTDRLSESHLFGDLKFKISSENFRGGSVSNVFGDIEIDISKCSLVSGRSNLAVNGVFGDITVYLPTGVKFTADCSAVAGDITVEENHREGLFPRIAYKNQDYPDPDLQLTVHISLVFGSIRIKR